MTKVTPADNGPIPGGLLSTTGRRDRAGRSKTLLSPRSGQT